ncbi:SKI family transcriptional corepressor 1 homolog-B-like isoform X8 [Carassius auratus]|uniref:SKI family transcriptional corepressor 1 homolog-B-like isoform X8 n=1 Tax=Carassius auratus TaxID=7957 RepID=A0A6P6NMD8_CARAU|nr:SKI family transcriptional corepressor 1 homolog-B-like isoform X8 [Carassius auratus]XP_026110072.1 SKI family transcriptional corepressor 1 homolog-B-like isoform X8 [Carassius auratus]
MESIPSQLSTGRDVCSSPTSKQELQPYSSSSSLKPNQVSETVLYGVPIVSLVIDGQERLCLAQISNTLLKNYSYNEIHNRRVALGITCVQCTPVQLEILRRAGAMPISSRRCGMITKREAERLCKSFLGAHNPPKLPENFAFDVSHECAWGSRGSFIPARYNSSRAKCIKCTYCNMYFSPNKFIFHSHRTPESKYTQPDAANFNSWRRHLKLADKSLSDDLCHAWEDVKAMFNGGSRKRAMPGHGSEMSSQLKPQASRNITQTASPDIPHKTLRCDDDRGNLSLTSSVRNYPLIPVPSKSFGMLQKIPPPIFPHPYSFPAFGLCQKKDDGVGEQNKTSVPGVFWPGAKDGIYPSFPMFWPTAGSLPLSSYQPAQPKPHTELMGGRHTETDLSESERGGNTPRDSLFDSERCSSSQSLRNDEDKSGDEARSNEGQPSTHRKLSYISAFRPVVKDAESIAKLYGNRDAYSGTHPGHLSPDFVSESSSYRSASPCEDSGEDPDVDVESHRIPEDEESIQLSVDDRQSPVRENSQTPPDDDRTDTDQKQNKEVAKKKDAIAYEVYSHETEGASLQRTLATKPPRCAPETNDSHISNNSPSEDECESQKSCSDQTSVCTESPSDATFRSTDNRFNFEKDIDNMAKEELQKQLLEQVELRKKLEREFQSLKGSNEEGTVLSRGDGPAAADCTRHIVQRVGTGEKGSLCNSAEA